MKPIYVVVLSFFIVAGSSLYAVPTLQVYSDGAVAGDWGPDQDTWYVSANPADIKVAVAFGSSVDEPVFHLGLLFSAPEGQTGTVTVSGEGINTTLSNIYLTKAQIEAIYPQNLNSNLTPLDFDTLNNHYPLQDSVSDFLILEIGDIYNQGDAIPDYNASDGIIENTGATGDIMNFEITVTGFTQLHIDAIGYKYNKDVEGGNWAINPGSHDVTMNPGVTVPVPGALGLAAIGLGFIGYLKRRKSI